MTIAKSITKTLDISVEDVRIDLTATIRSYDLTDTQFIFEIKSSNGITVNLTGSTAIYIVEYVHNSQTYAIQGDINIIGTDTLSFNLPEDLKGYSGTVLIGIYVKLTDGTKIDIKDIAVRIEPSIMDKDIDFSAKTYFKDFESVKAEVVLEGEKVKTEINAVLPSVLAEISEIKTEIENLPDIPDLFVAYADDLNGSGFSKTDTTKLYKGFGVKNSDLPADYRWERNVEDLSTGGDNLIINGGFPTDTKGWWRVDGDVNFTVTSHPFYFNGQKRLFKISTATNSEKRVATARFKVKRNTRYTISFDGFSASTVKDTDVTFLGRKNIDASDFTIIKPIFANLRMPPTGSNTYKATFDVGDCDEGYIRFDHNGSTNGQEASMFFGEVMLVEGNVVKKYQPSSADLMLNSNPVNSILTTLSAENPSTTLGGTWTQLGTESKFNNTIYYWKRTQ